MTGISRRLLLAGVGALAAGPVWADAYPERPVRIVAPFAPGGPSDLAARLFAAKLSAALGRSFFVENHAGAGSNIGTALVARASPDGYTLLISSSAFVVNPGLYKRIPYDPVTDFAPVCEMVTSPNVFIARKGSGITSIPELIARAKAQPDMLSFASAGIGTTPHLAGEMLNVAAGIKLVHVPYNGAGPAMESILSGTVSIACAALPGAHPSIQNGDVVALAVTGTDRWWDLPTVPTMIDLGYAGFVSDTFHGAWLPAGTPTAIVERLTAAMIGAMQDKPFAEQLRGLGFEVIARGPDGLRARVDREVPMYKDLIAHAKIDRV
jgi:tripartite-type tricarboxylate transporter receptor subunit TctC